MMALFKSWFKQHHLLLLVLLTGLFVRIYGLSDAGFHHDELSALLRTRFTDFSALIRQGVMVDGHPAFTQVFLWFWIDMFGSHAAFVKIPFLFAGCLSIYLLYLVARELFSKPVALLAAASLAVLQYGVIYSQWARPYAFGLFFMLWATLALVKYHKNSGSPWLIQFAAAAALAGYTHYFALLQVMIVAILIWLFMLKKTQRLYLIVAALVAMLLWLPHLNITLYHLSLGGLGDWLKPPKLDFALHLLAFSANYSAFFWPLVISALFAFFLKANINRDYLLKMALLFGAVLIPFLIGFAYSHLKSALLHEGNMLFAFPFLLLLFAGAFNHLHNSLIKLVGVIVLIIGFHSLFYERFHPQLNLTTEFKDPFDWHKSLLADYGKQGLTVNALFDLRPDAVSWLKKHQGYETNHIALIEALPDQNWQQHLNSMTSDHLLLVTTAASVPELLPYALHCYPHIEEVHHYRSASCYLLARYPAQIFDLQVIAVEHPGTSLLGEPFVGNLNFKPISKLPKTIIAVKAQLIGKVDKETKLVLEGGKGENRFWRAMNVVDFKQHAGYYEPVVAVDLRDICDDYDIEQLSAYIWNPSKGKGSLQTLSAIAVPSNPVLYGLFNPIADKSLLEIEDRIIKSLLTLNNQNQGS